MDDRPTDVLQLCVMCGHDHAGPTAKVQFGKPHFHWTEEEPVPPIEAADRFYVFQPTVCAACLLRANSSEGHDYYYYNTWDAFTTGRRFTPPECVRGRLVNATMPRVPGAVYRLLRTLYREMVLAFRFAQHDKDLRAQRAKEG